MQPRRLAHIQLSLPRRRRKVSLDRRKEGALRVSSSTTALGLLGQVGLGGGWNVGASLAVNVLPPLPEAGNSGGYLLLSLPRLPVMALQGFRPGTFPLPAGNTSAFKADAPPRGPSGGPQMGPHPGEHQGRECAAAAEVALRSYLQVGRPGCPTSQASTLV